MKTLYGNPQSVSASATRERYRLCPACGNFSASSQGQTFCIVCGTKLIEECPQCLEPVLYPTGRFCPMCGVRLVTGEHAQGISGGFGHM